MHSARGHTTAVSWDPSRVSRTLTPATAWGESRGVHLLNRTLLHACHHLKKGVHFEGPKNGLMRNITLAMERFAFVFFLCEPVLHAVKEIHR